MAWLYSLIGMFLGAFLGGVVFRHEMGWTAAALGAVMGALFARVAGLGQQVRKLQQVVAGLNTLQEAQIAAMQDARIAAQHAQTTRRAEAAAARATAPERSEVPRAPRPVADSAPPAATVTTAEFPMLDALLPEPPPAPHPGRAVFDIGPEPATAAAAAAAAPARPAAGATRPAPAQLRATRPAAARENIHKAQDYSPSPIEVAFDAVKRWFTEGNVPVKIGVLVLFLGVGALMKYAADQGWLSVPLEVRMAGIAAAALAGLVFGWRKRESHRAFALSLQGGMIGILILVVFGSFKLYSLIPGGMAFTLLVVIVASAGIMAVAQDALALAVLAIVGGFLAPILTSSDSGNHVALFAYYAVLNTAILGIAWVKPWRALNLLGFAFTFGIATFWGTLKYRPELFASTEPFLVLFYAFYLLIPLLYALRQPDQRRGLVDGSLVFGTPLLAFPLQAALLQGDARGLAISALVLALVHVGVGWFALRRLRMSLLGQSHVLLALGFATLAVPLALSARSTACAWAVEGAALVWLGLRQQRQLPRVIGYLLQLAAGLSLLIAVANYSDVDSMQAVFNGDFLAIALLSAAGFTCAWLQRKENGASDALTRLVLVWSLLWWLALGINEIARFVPNDLIANWLLGFAALTALLSSEAGRRLDWSDLGWPAFLAVLIAPLFIAVTSLVNPAGPLSGLGLAAWGLWFVASLRAQRNLDVLALPALGLLHFVHTWTWCLLFCAQIVEYTHRSEVALIWRVLSALLPFALAFGATLARWRVLRFPLEDGAEKARPALLGTLSALLGICWVLGLVFPGDPAPLPYLPVLNPLEIVQIGFVVLLLAWFRQSKAESGAILDEQFRAQLLSLTGFALLTSITLRSVHFLGGVPWSDAMFRSALAQACLSVVWCLAGLGAMLLGARRASRPIWIGGATLVGLVILKLILIDRTHLKDLYAILGVLAVGGLLMVVGWFAPNPPKENQEAA